MHAQMGWLITFLLHLLEQGQGWPRLQREWADPSSAIGVSIWKESWPPTVPRLPPSPYEPAP